MNIDIKKMTIREKLGQLIIVGFHGYDYNENLKTLIEDYKVSNFILFKRNIKDLKQLTKLNHDLYSNTLKNTNTIPFISIDQEGGMVTRIMNEACFCPGSMTLCATNDTNNAYITGKIKGKELSYLGINMNLAPSLDVNNNPLNPVIGVRSYADDPKKVTDFGKSYIKGLQEEGILATAKHFPGHGDVSVDSHRDLPVVSFDKKRIHEIELYPFKNVVNDVNAIMSAHIMFTEYDNLYPATLSRNVLTDLLKDELGFKGLIVSDCLEMNAIKARYTTEKASIMGLKAGLDMFFICHTFNIQVKSLEMLEEAIQNGEIDEKELDEKVLKVLSYKEKVKDLMMERFVNNDNNLDCFKNNQGNKEILEKIVKKSLTLVKGNDFELEGKTLIVSAKSKALSVAEDEIDDTSLIKSIKNSKLIVDTYEYESNSLDLDLINIVKNYDNVVFASFNAFNDSNQQMTINELSKVLNDRLFVISMRNPYDILKLNVKNYLTFYEYTKNSISSCVNYLCGNYKASGVAPIELNVKTK